MARLFASALVFGFGGLLVACSGSESSSDAASNTGGQVADGTADTGGAESTSPSVGGTSGNGGGITGGIAPTGGSNTGAGGAPASGGATSGGAGGGIAPTGGSSTGVGGGPASGGAASGGNSGLGGSATGGVAPTGGSTTDVGGLPASGGAASGGTSASGGSATGGTAPTGGVTASGGSDATGGTTSTVTCPAGGWAPGDKKLTLNYDGIDRHYEVHIPPGYTGTSPVPVMLVIHGAHNTPAMARMWSQMDPVSDQNGFIVVYPAGLDCWNAGGILSGCTAADDDLGFLKNVVTEVEKNACIDPKRVYATGISNGAMMAQYLGCQAADIFASVGGVAGPTGQCSPSRPVSVFYVHGTEDSTVPYSSAQPNVTGWADRDGCGTTPVETHNQGSTACVTYQGCEEGVEVVFCTVTGMGHCWPEDTSCMPGGGAQYGVTDFKASPMMWEFFSKHPMP